MEGRKAEFHHDIALLLLLMWVTISECITADSSARVEFLPGFEGALPFDFFSGYISVDEVNEYRLFYYLIKSENNPSKDPLLLWLTGGPGCSGFSGLVIETGPLRIKVEEYNGTLPALRYNPYSWTKVANVIYVDSPIGTGFSYSKSPPDYATSDSKTVKDLHKFLTNWFIEYPEFLSNPLYIAGDSYSGITVPVLTSEIANGIDSGYRPVFNLKGYLVGNPVTDVEFDSQVVPFAHGMGLISDELFEATKISCNGKYAFPKGSQCNLNMQAVHECLSRINTPHILEPLCPFASPRPRVEIGTGLRRWLHENSSGIHLQSTPIFCRTYGYMLSHYWANNERVQEVLHVKKGTVNEWKRCNYGINFKADVASSVVYHYNLTMRGYSALIYSGDHDSSVPFIGTQAWIRSLEFPIIDDWRAWLVDGQVVGYTRKYTNNLTFATVKGAGHTAPEYKPKECVAMLKRWISNEPL
ncbi:serine carboxypeptidase-like 7 isoform X1 [Amborella trichopoda]|uniref:serine carboxypeptidase-like 7 isoform X1 n=1 Tax=Amborella trichopoda TaxID=13333 RepID=UPI0005D2EFCF|nr:serine carboxypeptidase-like 7 isoform X1 [Amborella trichopoda]|eukprot:XP_011627623.1 serine carboxypeptidase-like 7 isoform X1 [Amborella trichopoda]